MSSMMSVRKGVRNADTSADAVGIESAGESLQLAYELHAQPRGLLISGARIVNQKIISLGRMELLTCIIRTQTTSHSHRSTVNRHRPSGQTWTRNSG